MQKTKEDLQKDIDELTAQLKDLREQLNEKSAVANGVGQEGWLIRCKNPGYTGRFMGILFEGGCAFLPKTTKDAAHIKTVLVNDFGYEVEEITSTEYEGKRKAAPKKETTMLDNIMQPHYVNG